MNINQTIQIILDCTVLAAALLSVVFTFGIVWRVEGELDIAYKLFLAAIIFFTLGELAGLLGFDNGLYIQIINAISKVLFIGFFLAGVLAMRDLIRKMDGEKKSDDELASAPAEEK